LHRNDLSTKSRYWRQMLNHRFFKEFQLTTIKKMIELKKRDIFLLIEKRLNQAKISLIWMFKYKFDTNEYVEKFKTRLCFRNNLQMIHQNIYAITLTARTFWTLMIIATAFDLDIWQYDAMSAFINNSIDEKIYNKCLDDFLKFDYCWKLLKTLYDLKQVSILWYRNLINVLEDLKLMSMLKINCLYANDWLILFFYVNDIVVFFHEVEHESHAYLWKSINAALWDENFRFFAMISEYSHHSRSRKAKNLIVSKFIHH
jgi:hypothetical protein